MEPTGQFDAFRARQAEERGQQETQIDYTFPPEYAADPNALFPPTEPIPLPFAAPYGAVPGGRLGAGRKWRSAAIFGGAVVLACAVGFGAWAAFGSSGPASSSTSASGTATAKATATGTATGKRAKALSFRVAIRSVGADSFSGTVPATGETVTIALTENTQYGTEAHPFSQGDLTAGEIVLVHGRRTGTDTVTATAVAAANGASGAGSALADATDGATGAAA